MLPTCVFMKPYKIFSYMHKPTINKVVQKFGLFIKFGILTLIFSIQFLSLLSLKVSEQKDTQNKDTHSFFFVRFHVSVHFYQSNIYIYIYIYISLSICIVETNFAILFMVSYVKYKLNLLKFL